jgi:hypothetical protein
MVATGKLHLWRRGDGGIYGRQRSSDGATRSSQATCRKTATPGDAGGAPMGLVRLGDAPIIATAKAGNCACGSRREKRPGAHAPDGPGTVLDFERNAGRGGGHHDPSSDETSTRKFEVRSKIRTKLKTRARRPRRFVVAVEDISSRGADPFSGFGFRTSSDVGDFGIRISGSIFPRSRLRGVRWRRAPAAASSLAAELQIRLDCFSAQTPHGDWDLFLMRPDGSNRRAYRHAGVQRGRCALFPDGKRLLYCAWRRATRWTTTLTAPSTSCSLIPTEATLSSMVAIFPGPRGVRMDCS